MVQKVAYIKYIGTITYDDNYSHPWKVSNIKSDSDLASQSNKFCLIFNKEVFDLIDISIIFSADPSNEKAYLKIVIISKECFNNYLSGASLIGRYRIDNSIIYESFNLHMLKNQNVSDEIVSECEKIGKFNAVFMREFYKISKSSLEYHISETNKKLEKYKNHLDRISRKYDNLYNKLTETTKLELDITNRRE